MGLDPDKIPPEECAGVLAHLVGTGRVLPHERFTNATVALALENAQAVNSSFSYGTSYYCPYGQYLTTINGVVESGNSYWALYINGQYANYGIDTQPINPGDSIGLTATTFAADKVNKPDSHQHQLLLRHRAARLDEVKTGAAK